MSALEDSERLLIKAWRDTLRKGDQVEVRDRKAPRPRLGKILNTTARGCGVLYESGHDGFAYWNDIYPTADRRESLLKHFDKTVKRATRGGATIADIVKIKGGVSLKVVPPPKSEEPKEELRPLTALPSMVRMTPSDKVPPGAHSHGHLLGSTTPEPPPAPEPPPEPKPKQMQPAKVIVVKQPKAEPPPAPPTPPPALPRAPTAEEMKPPARTSKRGDGRAAHALTDIAIALRTERIRRGETQREASVTLRISAPVLSRLELGVDHPTDDQLLCYVDHYKMDLNALLRARDGQDENVEPEPAKVEHVAEPRPITMGEVLKAIAPTPAPEPPNERLDWFMDVLDFTERLKLAIPFPAEVEKRRAWYKAALMMFEVHNGS